MTQTVWLRGEYQRRLAHQLIDKAPINAVVKISPEERSVSQNDKMWAMISDISRHKPEGRIHVPEVWKAIFMAACGHEVQFEHGLDGRPFPIGFRSSHLTKSQMSDLIECIISYGQQHGVIWSDGIEKY
jgi:hypothetical protein